MYSQYVPDYVLTSVTVRGGGNVFDPGPFVDRAGCRLKRNRRPNSAGAMDAKPRRD